VQVFLVSERGGPGFFQQPVKARRRSAMIGRSRLMVVLAAATLIFFAMATVVQATGTGDNPARTENVLTPQERQERARADAEYAQWLAKKGYTRNEIADLMSEGAHSNLSTGSFIPQAMDGGYRYHYTPSHKQETNYWCGPATVQVIDDYFGDCIMQRSYAIHMGTTPEGGTDFSVVDDELRSQTENNYQYRTVTWSVDFFNRVEYAIDALGWPIALDGEINPGELGYNYHHAGHIFPVEGFDWRGATDYMRKNDVYNEADYYTYGGNTFGHQIYDAAQFYHVVERHWRHAIIGA
jgi:hypothetical protein